MNPLDFPRRVFVIVDAQYGEQLAALPPGAAVRVIDSPANTPVARRLWQQCRPVGPRAGITTFNAQAAAPAQQLRDILHTVEEHEGEDSAGGSAVWEVIGCTPDAATEQVLVDLCLRVVEVTEHGFVARYGC